MLPSPLVQNQNASHGMLREPGAVDNQLTDEPDSAIVGFATQLLEESRPIPADKVSVALPGAAGAAEDLPVSLQDGKLLPVKGTDLPLSDAAARTATALTTAAEQTKLPADELQEFMRAGLPSNDKSAETVASRLPPQPSAPLPPPSAHPVVTPVADQKALSSELEISAEDMIPVETQKQLRDSQILNAADKPMGRKGATVSLQNAASVAEVRQPAASEISDQPMSSSKLSASAAMQSVLAETIDPSQTSSQEKPSSPALGAAAPAAGRNPQPSVFVGAEANSAPVRASELVANLDNRVRVMVEQGQQAARLQLAPSELGALEIHLTGEGDQARLSVVAHSQQARDMLEQQLPRLREALEQQGIKLADANVSDGSGQSGDRGQEAAKQGIHSQSLSDQHLESDASSAKQSLQRSDNNNQIDYYA